MKWYYAIVTGVAGTNGAQQAGPVDDAEFERLIQSGVIRPDTLVWREGMASWQPMSTVHSAPVSSGPAVTQPVYPQPVYPGAAPQQQYSNPQMNPQQASQPWGTAPAAAGYGAAAFQQNYQAPPLAGVRYAGFWVRFVARVIDAVILFFVHLIIRLPLGLMLGVGSLFTPGYGGLGRLNGSLIGPGFFGYLGLSSLLGLAISVGYEVYFVSTRGATPGKMAMGLKIIQADGSAIPPGLALGRYLATWVSGFIFFIGYIMAGFDSQKRALHDMICNTRVIHVR